MYFGDYEPMVDRLEEAARREAEEAVTEPIGEAAVRAALQREFEVWKPAA